jgi:hypothetical protein
VRRLALSLAAIGGLGASTAARARPDAQLWTWLTATVKLSPRWRLSEEAVARFSDNRNGLYEIESTTSIGLRLSKVTTLWAGYTHDPQYTAGHFTTMEQRARQQVTFDNFAALGPGKVSARIRFEERWREGVDGTGWRVRPTLRYSLPLRGRVTLNLSTEPFFDLNTTGFQRTAGLDRVRNLATVSVPLSKHMTGEAGYMNQHGFVRGGPDTSDNIAYFALNLSL